MANANVTTVWCLFEYMFVEHQNVYFRSDSIRKETPCENLYAIKTAWKCFWNSVAGKETLVL